MNCEEKLIQLQKSAESQLFTNIMPFWRDHMIDEEKGGFWGRVKKGRIPDPDSPKSLVLNTRLLWAYVRAFRQSGDEIYQTLALRAFRYIQVHFYDPVYGGVYWMVTCNGQPGEVEKRTYAQAFFIYAMAAYYEAFEDSWALETALQTLRLLENHAKCPGGGYLDSLTRDWLQDDWVNFWVKNRNGCAKLLNSNMHLFEAILALAEVTNHIQVKRALRDQLLFLLNTAMDWERGHFKAGIHRDGRRADGEINFGHDSECSYLCTRAAELLGDAPLLERSRSAAELLMNHALQEGLDARDGAMYYLADCWSNQRNPGKIWWVQAEGVTAFLNCFQWSQNQQYAQAAIGLWEYIQAHLVNQEDGDWYAVGPGADGAENHMLNMIFSNEEMAGKGKCPYHNARVCYEVMSRVGALLGKRAESREG